MAGAERDKFDGVGESGSSAPDPRSRDQALALQPSAREDADRERERLIDELREKLRDNEIFAGILAHDLRTPLAAITMGARLALAITDSPAIVRPLERVLASSERVGRMVNQLLDFTRVRVGEGIMLEPRETDLAALCKQAAAEIEDANPDWELRVRSEGDVTGSWDPDRLLQVVSNLASNAVEHGKVAGGVTIEIEGMERGAVTLRVRNQGTIPRSSLSSLFAPFRRGPPGASRSKGLGLGLFITEQIARAHGGTVEVSSSRRTGTTIVVRLPRRPPAGPARLVVGSRRKLAERRRSAAQ
jgi:signal transduction histidine kinase